MEGSHIIQDEDGLVFPPVLWHHTNRVKAIVDDLKLGSQSQVLVTKDGTGVHLVRSVLDFPAMMMIHTVYALLVSCTP